MCSFQSSYTHLQFFATSILFFSTSGNSLLGLCNSLSHLRYSSLHFCSLHFAYSHLSVSSPHFLQLPSHFSNSSPHFPPLSNSPTFLLQFFSTSPHFVSASPHLSKHLNSSPHLSNPFPISPVLLHISLILLTITLYFFSTSPVLPTISPILLQPLQFSVVLLRSSPKILLHTSVIPLHISAILVILQDAPTYPCALDKQL